VKRRHLTELPSIILLQSRNTCFCRILLPVKLFLPLAGALLVPLYSYGQSDPTQEQLEKCGAAWDKARKVQRQGNTGKGMPRMNCGGFEATLDSSVIPL
jgi:hypothetical protein